VRFRVDVRLILGQDVGGMYRGAVSIPALVALVAVAAVALTAACGGRESEGFASPAPDAGVRDAPRDVAMGDLALAPATPTARDSGDEKSPGDDEAGGSFPCPPPTNAQDGSIVPPPRPCDAGAPPPPKPH
jgi:hypothetical protein